jgi:hypothetical protein
MVLELLLQCTVSVMIIQLIRATLMSLYTPPAFHSILRTPILYTHTNTHTALLHYLPYGAHAPYNLYILFSKVHILICVKNSIHL